MVLNYKSILASNRQDWGVKSDGTLVSTQTQESRGGPGPAAPADAEQGDICKPYDPFKAPSNL